MNDPQIWTLLGVFAAIMLGGMTFMTTMLMRTMTTAIGGVHARIDGLAGEMKAGFAAVDAKFETVYVKLEHLDRDVSALSRKVFGIPSD
ncbi:MAG TPA: hypothetical protein PK781_04080 [Terrimesophilobacter sp.]|nr:hypothetical protein [Terrimesophilobacter sp.]